MKLSHETLYQLGRILKDRGVSARTDYLLLAPVGERYYSILATDAYSLVRLTFPVHEIAAMRNERDTKVSFIMKFAEIKAMPPRNIRLARSIDGAPWCYCGATQDYSRSFYKLFNDEMPFDSDLFDSSRVDLLFRVAKALGFANLHMSVSGGKLRLVQQTPDGDYMFQAVLGGLR